MPLMNYTTEVPADRSVAEIQKELVKHKAKSIMIDYQEGVPVALSFLIPTKHGELSFRLPANIEAVKRVMVRQNAPGYRKQGQPVRVAWRILRDWIKAQTAILETEMVVPEEVFLPYMVVEGKKTLYEELESRGFLALPEPKARQ